MIHMCYADAFILPKIKANDKLKMNHLALALFKYFLCEVGRTRRRSPKGQVSKHPFRASMSIITHEVSKSSNFIFLNIPLDIKYLPEAMSEHPEFAHGITM